MSMAEFLCNKTVINKYQKQNGKSKCDDVASAQSQTHRGQLLLSIFSVAQTTIEVSLCHGAVVLLEWRKTCMI